MLCFSIGDIFSGLFLFLEASKKEQESFCDLEILVSNLNSTSDDFCLELWYHMSGEDIGRLVFLALPESSENRTIHTIYKEGGTNINKI